MTCRSVITVLAAFVLVGPLLPQHEAQAQVMAQGAGIGFRNDLKFPVIVQGVSLVNNMQRRGQPILVSPGKTVWDNNVAGGVRFYTIYEATQQRVLIQNRPVRVQGADQFFAVHMTNLNGIVQVKMDPEKLPVP